MTRLWGSKVFQIIFSAIMSFLLLLLTQRFVSGREYAKSISDKFSERPTNEQVNSQFIEIKKYIDAQDDNMVSKLDQHIEESNRTSSATMDYLKSLDGNVKLLLGRTK